MKNNRICNVLIDIWPSMAVYLVLLLLNYFLIAVFRMSMTYVKTLPSISCVRGVALLQCLFFSIYYLLHRNRIYMYCLLSIHFFSLLILFAVYLTTGTVFTESFLFLIYDTSIAEIKDFFIAYVKLWHCLVLSGVVFLFYYLMFMIDKKTNTKVHCSHDSVLAIVFFLLFLIFPLQRIIIDHQPNVLNAVYSVHPFYKMYEVFHLFHKNAGEFTYEMKHRQSDFSLERDISDSEITGIFVIGESAIRGHHSIYGYSRNTSPNLLRYKEELAVYDDVITVKPMTIVAVKYLLTNMTLENKHISWTIFDVLKRGGYSIEVISNQNKSGWADSPIQMIFSDADKITYMHQENISNDNCFDNNEYYDEKMLPFIEEWIASSENLKSNRLLFVHLFGSHEPFFARYPKQFNQSLLKETSFPTLTNEYDTSILYTDFVLGKILDNLNTITKPCYMIYIPDHGAVCDETQLRTPNSVQNSAYEIPLIIWTNSAYRQKYNDTYKKIMSCVHLPLQTDQLDIGLLEIMQCQLKDIPETNNFLSPSFQVRERMLDDGNIPYKQKHVNP